LFSVLLCEIQARAFFSQSVVRKYYNHTCESILVIMLTLSKNWFLNKALKKAAYAAVSGASKELARSAAFVPLVSYS